VKFTEGALAAPIAIPADLAPGTYAIVIFVAGDGGATPTAAGARTIRIEGGGESRTTEPK
jgi:hypothetical protein